MIGEIVAFQDLAYRTRQRQQESRQYHAGRDAVLRSDHSSKVCLGKDINSLLRVSREWHAIAAVHVFKVRHPVSVLLVWLWGEVSKAEQLADAK